LEFWNPRGRWVRRVRFWHLSYSVMSPSAQVFNSLFHGFLQSSRQR
jgi:hypothetical protein